MVRSRFAISEGRETAATLTRTVALVRRIGIEPEVASTGGVTRNIGMVKALEEKLQLPVDVCEDPHFTGGISAKMSGMLTVV